MSDKQCVYMLTAPSFLYADRTTFRCL